MTASSDETRLVRVTSIVQLASDVRGYELKPADGRPLPPFSAGSHIDVHTPGGFIRQYSLYSDPASANYAIAVKHELAGRGGSRTMHSAVEVGSHLGIVGPRNHFPLVANAPHSVLVAGGIGITPIHAMIQTLAAEGRGWELHYCARAEAHAAFFAELRDRFPTQVKSYFSEIPLLDVDALLRQLPADAHLYCCGPAGLMQAVQAAAQPDQASRVHFEWFAAPQSAHEENRPFEVELAQSGHVFEIPADRSILQVLRSNGVDVPSSCEEGVCGSCETRVLEGEVDHRDMLLSADERQSNQCMMVCVSRAKGRRLVLDR